MNYTYWIMCLLDLSRPGVKKQEEEHQQKQKQKKRMISLNFQESVANSCLNQNWEVKIERFFG